MPLPLILGAAALIAGGVGVKKGLDAHSKNSEASDYINCAKSLATKTENAAKSAEQACGVTFENLGKAKLAGMKNLDRFIAAFEQIKNIEMNDINIGDLRNISISKDELKEMKKIGHIGSNFASGLAQGSVAGGLAALGAYGGTMAFATASTGTAISTLAGAAATNATLAALGGGSLAAGGLGMMGGAAVLGGLVAGPALAILGFTMNSKAEANLDKAITQYNKVKAECEKIQINIDRCNKISKIGNIYTKTTNDLNLMFEKLLDRLETLLYYGANDYSRFRDNDKKLVAMSMAVAKAVKSIICVQLVSKDNMLTAQAEKEWPLHQETVKKISATL